MAPKRVEILVKFTTGTTIEDADTAKEACESLLKAGLNKAELAFDFEIVGTHVEDLTNRD